MSKVSDKHRFMKALVVMIPPKLYLTWKKAHRNKDMAGKRP